MKAVNERSDVVKAQEQWAQSNSDDIGRAKIDNETVTDELCGECLCSVVE